jgi:O-antigen/teichoic acid export membrane protein
MTGLVGLITFVVGLGVDLAGVKYIAEKNERYESEFSTYLLLKMLLILLFIGLAIFFMLFVFRPEDPLLYIIIMCNMVWMSMADVFKRALTARRAFLTLALRNSIARVIMLFFAVIFCTLVKNWYYIAILPSIEHFILVMVLLYYFVKKLNINTIEFNRKQCIKFIKYAAPLSISEGISVSIANLDKVFVGFLLTNVHVGYLAVAEKVYNFFMIIVKAFTQQLLPEISYRLSNLKKEIFAIQMEKIVFMSNLMGALMTLFIILFAEIMITLVYGEEAGPSAVILKVFTLMILIKLFFRPYHSLIYATEKQGLFLWFTVPTYAVRIILTYALIPLSIGGHVIGGSAAPISKAFAWMFPRGLYILWEVKKTFGSLFCRRAKITYILLSFAVGTYALFDMSFKQGTTIAGVLIFMLFFYSLFQFRLLDKALCRGIWEDLKNPFMKTLRDFM